MAKVEVFESTLQKTDQWLNELSSALGIFNKQEVYHILKGVLHALRDRLPLETAVKFSSQVPMLVRGFYFESWVPSHVPIKVRSSEEFISFVAAHLPEIYSQTEIETSVKMVFRLLENHISAGEIDHLKAVLPPSIAELFEKT
jgi:uncharacterized protein (DUF2267 family)